MSDSDKIRETREDLQYALDTIKRIKNLKSEVEALQSATVAYILGASTYTPDSENTTATVRMLTSMINRTKEYMDGSINLLEQGIQDTLKKLTSEEAWNNPLLYIGLNKIEAIKKLREKSGFDLKTSKETMDQWLSDGRFTLTKTGWLDWPEDEDGVTIRLNK